MRETSSPPSEMCFMTTFLSDGRGGVVAASCFVHESTGSRDVRVPVDRGTSVVSQGRAVGSTLDLVDTKKEIRDFLTSRRARITPEQAGLRSYGSRRVPGLRREEVAVLAGVSVPYYTRLERGDMNGVSESVLEALTRALQLDDAERAHLLDLLAANQLGRALYSELYAAPARPVNTARFVFLDPRAEASYGDWDRVATETVAILRSAAGRDPYNRDLSDLVGELATQSEAFRTRWAAHNVRFHNTGVKDFHHPVVGDLTLSFNRLDLAADHGLTLFTYTAEPGSRSEEALKLLGSWAATVDPAERVRATDQT